MDRNFIAGELLKASKEVTGMAVLGMNVDEFVSRFFEMSNQLYLFHWQTSSHAQHLAFGDTNDALAPLMDQFVESYQGKYGRVSFLEQADLVDYGDESEVGIVRDYRDYLVEFKELVANEPDLANIVDEMIALINKLLYLLSLK